jgi:hypothetical protein
VRHIVAVHVNLEPAAEPLIEPVRNHAQFSGTNGNYASSRFGLVSTTLPPRIGQLSLKLVW